MANDLADQLFPPMDGKGSAPAQPQMQQQDQMNTQQTSGPSLADQLFPNQQKTPQSAFMDAVDAFNAKVTNLAAGEMQLFAKGLQAVGVDTSQFQQRLAGVNQVYQAAGQQAAINSPKAALTGQILGDVANIVNTAAQAGPAGASALTSGAGTVGGRVLQSAGLGATEAAAEYGNTEQRLERGAIGGALGALGQGVVEGIGAAGRGILGRIASKNAPSVGEGALLNQVEPQTAGMLLGGDALQSATTKMANVPMGLGTKGAVKAAAKDVAEVANNTLSDLGVGKKSMSELGEALVNNIKTAEGSARTAANAAYNEAADFAVKNNIDIPLTATQKMAQDIITEKSGLASSGFSALSPGKDAELLQNFVDNPQISAEKFESLRKALNARIRDFRKGADPDNMAGALSSLKQSMEVDLLNTGENIGGKYNELLQSARNLYQQTVVPFKENRILDRATGNLTIDSDALLNQAISNNAPQKTAQIMKQLTPTAQKDFSAAILQKVSNNAMDNAGNIDMVKLATGIKNLRETVDALPGDTKNIVKGLQTFISRAEPILKAAKADSSILGSAASTLATGAGGMALYLGAINPLHAILGAAGSKGLAKMLTSKTIGNQLLRLNGLTGQTKDETVKYILKQMFKKSIIPAAAAGVAEQQVP